MNKWPWRGAWKYDKGFPYKANDCVDRDGISYRCLYDHYPSSVTGPGKGKNWEQVWQRLGQTKPEHKSDTVWQAWRNSPSKEMTFFYQKGEYVRHQGHKFVCRIEHSAHKATEPGVSERWFQYWDLIEENPKPAPTIIENPEPKAKLFIGVAGTTPTEVNIGDLAELIAKGDCEIHFEVRQPCKPIKIMDMELLEFEEMEDGTARAHFLLLRDLTDEEE